MIHSAIKQQMQQTGAILEEELCLFIVEESKHVFIYNGI